jgi:hypothetical protein
MEERHWYNGPKNEMSWLGQPEAIIKLYIWGQL